MDFDRILKDHETENIEFKSSVSLRKKIGIAISAFSNKEGGLIFVGIDDARNILGLTVGKNTLEDLANYIIANTDPRCYPSIKVETIGDKKVIVIEVHESDEKPIFFRGRAYVRVGRTNQILSASQVREFFENGRYSISWDEKVLEKAILDDIDVNKVKWFLENAESERNRDIDPQTPVREALNKLDLLKDDSLTNAALLLFGKNPQKFFLQAQTKCAKFIGNNLDFDDMKIFDGSLFDQRKDALNFVIKHIKHSGIIKGTERDETLEYPIVALREAITNAICHRDYQLSSNVQINIFDDRIEIWGCGSLPGNLTIDDLKVEHTSVPRNKLIAKRFFDIKFIENWGTGTLRMIQSCIDHGLPEPIFEIKSGNLVVTINKYKFSLLTVKDLEKSQQKAIDYLLDHETITNREYRELNPGIDRNTATDELKDLANKGFVISKGKLASTYYILNK
jgi:ATP-dependent DNA helicase RecG